MGSPVGAGEWEDDGWVQSAAEPSKCRVAGPGITRAVAGQQAEFLIQVWCAGQGQVLLCH